MLASELFYMLNTVSLEIPPLRQRRGDIRPLAEHFLAVRQFALGGEEHFASKTLELLQSWDWPGDVRELRTVVERGNRRAVARSFGISERSHYRILSARRSGSGAS